MSKIENLANAFNEMAECAEKMKTAALALRDFVLEKQSENEAKKTVATGESVNLPVTVAEPIENEPETKKDTPEPRKYSFADVRKAFSAKAHDGFTAEVKALITKYGAGRLSAVKEEDYPAIMADLEAIS